MINILILISNMVIDLPILLRFLLMIFRSKTPSKIFQEGFYSNSNKRHPHECYGIFQPQTGICTLTISLIYIIPF